MAEGGRTIALEGARADPGQTVADDRPRRRQRPVAVPQRGREQQQRRGGTEIMHRPRRRPPMLAQIMSPEGGVIGEDRAGSGVAIGHGGYRRLRRGGFFPFFPGNQKKKTPPHRGGGPVARGAEAPATRPR